MADILLARPHPFIISDMIPLLQGAGMRPIKPVSLGALRIVDTTRLKGAVISLAISSSIGASVSDVVRTVREVMPQMPLLFAGLTDMTFAAQAIRRAMDGELAAVRSVSDTLTIQADCSGGIVVGYVSKANLSTPRSRQATQALLVSYFT